MHMHHGLGLKTLMQVAEGLDTCPEGLQCIASIDMVLATTSGAVPMPYAIYMALTTTSFQASMVKLC